MSQTQSHDLSVKTQSIELLTLDPRNPRQHSARQVRQIARSIESFGFNVPVLINSDGQVVAGHGRVLAARMLGWSEVPTVRLDHLTAAQARAFAIADNRLSEQSSWDNRLLGEIFAELEMTPLDFNIEATGFSMAEIDLRIGELSTPDGGAPDPVDHLPIQPSLPLQTNRGDLWLLNNHRILCGDALDSASYETLMQDAQAAMVFTDPPYNVPIDGHVSGKGNVHHREFEMAVGEMTEGQFTDFLAAVCRQLTQYSPAGSLHYLCMDWRHMQELLTAARRTYSELKNLCVWNKTNAGMGSLYRSQHELIFVFKNGTAPHRNNVQLGKYGRNRTNVWTYAGPNNFGRGGDEGNLAALHPTVKPVSLVADAILDCTSRGDIVLDPFLGSGSTLIAAERTGRRCYGMEIDPLYVDTAIRRWQQHTGQDAVHATSGKRFNDLANTGAQND